MNNLHLKFVFLIAHVLIILCCFQSGNANDRPGEKDILRYAFTDRLIEGEQILEPITTLEGIQQANQTLYMPANLFFTAYQNLKLEAVSHLQLDEGTTKVLKLTYRLGERSYQAFAYAPAKIAKRSAAGLIIPGSRQNLGSDIYRKVKTNHIGIVQATQDVCDQFVFIKPNEDCLAFHDGKKKLNVNFIVNWHLNRGSSYSASYIVGSLAITKYLQEKYDKLIIAGLSQGGYAAFLNSLQSRPNAAVIASGFSVLSEKIEWSGHNQIIIPGVEKHYSNEKVLQLLKQTPTRYLFTYGTKEVGTYRIEANQRKTCQFFAGLSNVLCRSHGGGHEYATEFVRKFLQPLVEKSKSDKKFKTR